MPSPLELSRDAPPQSAGAGPTTYRGDCGATVRVLATCLDAGGPVACSCGAELYPAEGDPVD